MKEIKKGNKINDNFHERVNLRFHTQLNLTAAIIIMMFEIIVLFAFLSIFNASPDLAVGVFVILVVVICFFFYFFVRAVKGFERLKAPSFKELTFSNRSTSIKAITKRVEDHPRVNQYGGKKKILVKHFGWIYFSVLFFICLFEILYLKLLVIKDKFIQALNNIFCTLEDFFGGNEYEGRKKSAVKWSGWFLIIFLFCLSVVCRMVMEYQSFDILYINWLVFFTFFVFVLVVGVIIVQRLTDVEYSKVIKLITLGFCIMILVPVVVDQFILGLDRNYYYVQWKDVVILFSSFFLHPSLKQYFDWGHIIMTFLLMALSGSYVFFRSYYDFDRKIKKSFSISLIKAIICMVTIYLLVGFSLITFHFVVKFLMLTLNFPTIEYASIVLLYPEYYIIIFNLYMVPFFILLILIIRSDEKQLTKQKEESLKRSLESKGSDYFKDRKQIEKEFNPSLSLKYAIVILLMIAFELTLFFTLY